MMNRAMKKPHTCLALTTLMIIISTASIEASGGFSIDLIHRDSVQSPTLYSASERVRNALQRSFIRAKTLVDDNEKVASTEIVPDKGEYLMKLSLGTPPVETLAIADTGSDLMWVQCQPCTRCFNQTAPIFQPKRSSTYKQIPCTSPTCAALPRNSCRGATCMYTMLYGDFSYSMGDLATETVKLGPASIPGVVMGCGHDDRGTFGAGASGIVGLGGGKVSLITQMGSSIQGKFSYCLVPYVGSSSRPSKMSFGADAVVSGAGVVSTPIVAKTPKTFYFLTLEGMTVGNQRLDSVSSSSLNDSKVSADITRKIGLNEKIISIYLINNYWSQLQNVLSQLLKKPLHFFYLQKTTLNYFEIFISTKNSPIIHLLAHNLQGFRK